MFRFSGLVLLCAVAACGDDGGADPAADASRADAPELADGATGPDGAADATPADAAAGSALSLDTPVVDFGLTEIGVPGTRTVTLRNGGATAITGIAPSVAGTSLTLSSTTCTATLDAGASCDLVVHFGPTALGVVSGSITVRGDGELTSSTVLGIGARRITVAPAGAGTGTITSTPAGLDCGAMCTGLFSGAVSLTVTPAADAELTEWTSGPCAGTATNPCSVAAGTSAVTASARIDVDTSVTLTLVVAGNASPGTYQLVYGDLPFDCSGGCTVDVERGASVTLVAATASTVIWSGGGCTGSSSYCSVKANADTQVTATFNRDDTELWTVVPAFAVESVAFAPDRDVLISNGAQVARYSANGSTLRWNVALPGTSVNSAVLGLETDAAGAAFVLADVSGGSVLTKVSPGGAIAWSRTLSGAVASSRLAYRRQLAVTPDNDVVVAAGGTVTRFDGDGTATTPPLWSRSVPTYAVAVDGNGALYVPTVVDIDDTAVLRFTGPSDTAVDLGHLTGYDASIAIGGGHVIGGSSGHSHVVVQKDFATLLSEGALGGGTYPQGVAADGRGDAISLRPENEAEFAQGMVLRRFMPSGTWQIIKPSDINVGVSPLGLAAHPDGTVAIVGVWRGYGSAGGSFVRVYARPTEP